MRIQVKIRGPATLLKLSGASDEDLHALEPHVKHREPPRDPHGGTPSLSAAEVLTILIWEAWRGLTDKAKRYCYGQTYHRQECSDLGGYGSLVGTYLSTFPPTTSSFST